MLVSTLLLVAGYPMVYEWRCTECNLVVEIQRTVAEYKDMPNHSEYDGLGNPKCLHFWKRKISISHPDFETMRDKGIFERLEKYT